VVVVPVVPLVQMETGMDLGGRVAVAVALAH